MIINFHVRRGENCYPMVPLGKSNAQMVGLPTPLELVDNLSRNCASCGETTAYESRFSPACGVSL